MAWTGCEVDGASRKLAMAAEAINLARNDIGAIPDLRPSQPGHLASPVASRMHRIGRSDRSVGTETKSRHLTPGTRARPRRKGRLCY